MAKPQLKFETRVNNFDMSPFKPIIQTKPHAIVPLEDSIRLVPNEEGVEQYVDLSQILCLVLFLRCRFLM